MKKLFAVLLVISLLVTGVSTALGEGDKVVNIGVTSTLTTMSPMHWDNTEIVKYALSLEFLPLMELNSALEFVPQLAESFTTEDNMTFTITLREGAAWSDGVPVTAEDVEYTMVLAADPACANPAMAMYAIEGTDDGGLIETGAEHIDGIRVLDARTLTVTTKWPTALYTFENNFGRYVIPLPKHVLSGMDRGELLTSEWFNAPDVISGPYFVSDFDLQHYVHYVANENFFLGAPKIKYLNLNVYEPSQLLAGLQSGEIDLIQQTMGSIPVEDYDAVRALDNVTAVNGTPVTNESIFINTARVTDPRIRQALLYGMDRQTMFESLLNGNGEVVDGFLVSASPFYSEALGVTEFDLDKAAQLVAEARADGAGTDLVWYVNASEDTFNQAVEYYTAILAEIGLNIEIRSVNLATLMEVAGNGEHDIMSVEYTYAPVDPYTDVAWLLGGEGSWTGYATEETDAALANTQALTDVEEVAGQYLIVDRAMQRDVPMISGWVIATLGAVSNRVTGATPNVFGTFVDVQNWDVVE